MEEVRSVKAAVHVVFVDQVLQLGREKLLGLLEGVRELVGSSGRPSNS